MSLYVILLSYFVLCRFSYVLYLQIYDFLSNCWLFNCQLLTPNSIQSTVPVLVDNVVALCSDHRFHLFGGAVVVDVELLQIGVGVGVSARVGLGAGTHRRYSEGNKMVAHVGSLAGGHGYIHVVVEESEGPQGLCKLPFAH